MAYLPLALAAVQAVRSGNAQKNADQYNSEVMTQERNLSINQANAQEGQVRRNSREMYGRQVAAIAAAGTGYQGSSGEALGQSALNQELDALNTRYKGALTGYGYGVQSNIDASAGADAQKAGYVNAITKLFSGSAGTYHSTVNTGS
jgi:hypothetical protein